MNVGRAPRSYLEPLHHPSWQQPSFAVPLLWLPTSPVRPTIKHKTFASQTNPLKAACYGQEPRGTSSLLQLSRTYQPSSVAQVYAGVRAQSKDYSLACGYKACSCWLACAMAVVVARGELGQPLASSLPRAFAVATEDQTTAPPTSLERNNKAERLTILDIDFALSSRQAHPNRTRHHLNTANNYCARALATMENAGGDETIANAAAALLSLKNSTTYSESTTGSTTTIARRCYSSPKDKRRASRALLLLPYNTTKSDTHIDTDHSSLLPLLEQLALCTPFLANVTKSSFSPFQTTEKQQLQLQRPTPTTSV